MLLENKTAVVYGAGGSIGGAVARAFAAEGAKVHLAGRTQATLDAVADEIRAAGGVAETAQVDALDAASVDAHADAVAAQDGGIDVSMNVITHPHMHGVPMVEMTAEAYARPVQVAVRTTFLTWRAAARHMIAQGGGAILAFGGSGDPLDDYHIGGTQLAFEAIESMRRQLAAELGPRGVRVVSLQTGGIPDSIGDAGLRRQVAEMTVRKTMLKRAATLEDVGRVAAFAASDVARTLTATQLNMTCGAVVD